MKEQFDTEKNNRITLLTEFNKLTALNDSLKSLDHGHKQRLQSMELGENKLREDCERFKRCYNCVLFEWCGVLSLTFLENMESCTDRIKMYQTDYLS